MVATTIPVRVAARAARKYTVVGECWVTGYSIVESSGYGQIGWEARGERGKTTVHRAAYVFHYGIQPGDLTVDHTCHNRACVNPAHLRLLTNRENAQRNGNGDFPLDWFCVRNHQGQRRNAAGVCVECALDYQRKYRARKRAVSW